MKNILKNYWELILFFALTVFNVGYTAAKLDTFATKYELKVSADSLRVDLSEKIDGAIDKHQKDTKDGYIRIDQVPGLNERLNSIDSGIKDLKEEVKLLRQRK